MHLENYSLDYLDFSKLFKDYTNNYSAVADFYEVNPHMPEEINKRAQDVHHRGDREAARSAIKSFNTAFPASDATFKNIDQLAEDDALAIVTGQQLGVYAGPLYTIYKTLTTVYLARQWQDKLNRPVIPVFWLADEDHDYDEVRRVQVLADEGLQSYQLPNREAGLPPVSELTFTDNLLEMRNKLRATLIETDFSDELWELLDACFSPGRTFLEGMGNFMARLFSDYGLVLAGSDDKAIKQLFAEPLARSIDSAEAARNALEHQSRKLADAYHQQATVYDSHLFYLHAKEGRVKIQQKSGAWLAGSAMQWTTGELKEEIASSPENFSPDVFLRPILQDRLLPTLGYVGGPGEIAYYGQMKSFYNVFDQQMPVIFPRMSATLIEPAIDRILGKLPFEFHEYDRRIEDLESDYVHRTEQTDIESLFKKWRQQTHAVATDPIQKISAIDDTLEGAAEKAKAVYVNELNKLKGKVYRAVKKDDVIQLNRIRRIRQNLFPERTLQERSVSSIYYMNKFGLDVWDRMLREMEEIDGLQRHKLIYL